MLVAKAGSLAETWEASLRQVHALGCSLKTQYDKPEDPPSKDCTMIMIVEDPMSEPAIHRCFDVTTLGIRR